MNIGVIEGLIRNGKYEVHEFDSRSNHRRVYVPRRKYFPDEYEDTSEEENRPPRSVRIVNTIQLTLKKDEEYINFEEEYDNLGDFAKDVTALGEIIRKSTSE